jgi:ubiquinone/menaquinone biosynthesis C-methylase UbiE
MSILHYFGNDPDKRARFIFDFIAPVYGSIDKGLQDSFAKAAGLLSENIPLKGLSVLDVGCGTGAWGAALQHLGAVNICGVDMSPKMLKEARKRHPDFCFTSSDARNIRKFDDNQFDIATASYVLHGVKADIRREILEEMKRLATKYVVIHDFYGKTPLFVQFLEFMERSDYKNFKRNFRREMEELFNKTEIIATPDGTALYIGFI